MANGLVFRYFSSANWIWLEPSVDQSNGRAVIDGFNPAEQRARGFSHWAELATTTNIYLPNTCRPDFILEHHRPTEHVRRGNWIVGDFKLQASTLVNSYNIGSGGRAGQYLAITKYAKTSAPYSAPLFILARGGPNRDFHLRRFGEDALFKKGVFPIVVTLFEKL